MAYKKIVSPIPEFPGTVEFPETLTLPEVVEYSDISDACRKDESFSKHLKLLPVIIKFTGAWDIQGIPERPTVATFPGAPDTINVIRLLRWLHESFIALIVGETTIPNLSRPVSIDTSKIPADSLDQKK